jgi:translation initiation factor eIF-2B subunit epsilon
MTVLFKEVGTWQPKVTASNYGTLTDTPVFSVSPLRSLSDDLVVALADPSSNEVSTRRILLYDSDPLSPTVSLPTSFFEAHANVQIHNDLSDTGIYICSPDVLARFSDEFDYLFISKFISNSVAEEETGLQNKIFAYILKRHEYAARIHDPRTYDAVSKDLLRRWAFPVVPDNLPSGYEKVYRYALEGRMVYRERKRGGTKVTRSSVIEGPSMIGSGCSIGEFCLIKVGELIIILLFLHPRSGR